MRNSTSNSRLLLLDLIMWMLEDGLIQCFTLWLNSTKMRILYLKRKDLWLMVALKVSEAKPELSYLLRLVVSNAVSVLCRSRLDTLCVLLEKHQDYLNTAFSSLTWCLGRKLSRRKHLTKIHQRTWIGFFKKHLKELTLLALKVLPINLPWELSRT